MIDFYYAPTPNGWKVAIALEEMALPYTLHPINLAAGEQFAPEFRAISPNAKMPAIVDDNLPVFESGAILWHLAEKTGQFMPSDPEGRKEVLEWLFWQTGNQGPMAGQLSHFQNYAPEGQDYGFKRYLGEYDRNLGVLEARLTDRDWIVGDAYSIADMIAFPWILIAKPLGASLEDFPRIQAWRARIKDRPAVRRAVDLLKDRQNRGQHTASTNNVLFNQSSAHLKG
ncbi:MAG: glutathione binding-like protein [Pseudomonadota bacterium]